MWIDLYRPETALTDDEIEDRLMFLEQPSE
jgi:hypothetical protein